MKKIAAPILTGLVFAILTLGFAHAQTLSMDQKGLMEVQTALKTAGYYHNNVDGVWNLQTVEAIREFQVDNGLERTGILTNRTIDALGVELNAAHNVHTNARGGILANEPVGTVGIEK